MEPIKEYEIGEGIFHYCIEKDKISIINFEGTTNQLTIPERIEEFEVTGISKKAYYGNRFLQYLILPETIAVIGDWAFAGCQALQKVVLPKKEITLGKQLFWKSYHLQEIAFQGCSPQLAKLMAASVTMLDAEYLLHPEQAGSDIWYRNFDNRMLTVLREPEENALKNLVYCAEEDMCGKQDACIRRQEYEKARLALHRITYDEGLSLEIGEYLSNYICQRTKGCEEESSWEVVKEELQEQKAYCEKMFAIGALHEENFNAALEDLGENHIELKAYLLSRWMEKKREKSVWNDLELG